MSVTAILQTFDQVEIRQRDYTQNPSMSVTGAVKTSSTDANGAVALIGPSCAFSELRYAALLQAFDHVEIGEGADLAVDVSLGIGRDCDSADRVDARGKPPVPVPSTAFFFR